jgi:hypothetical protein
MDLLDKVYKRSDEMVIRKFGDDCILIPSRQGVGDVESIYRLGWLRRSPYTPSPIPIIGTRRTAGFFQARP